MAPAGRYDEITDHDRVSLEVCQALWDRKYEAPLLPTYADGEKPPYNEALLPFRHWSQARGTRSRHRVGIIEACAAPL